MMISSKSYNPAYRRRERRQPPVGVHAIADGDSEEDAIEHPADAVEDSKNA